MSLFPSLQRRAELCLARRREVADGGDLVRRALGVQPASANKYDDILNSGKASRVWVAFGWVGVGSASGRPPRSHPSTAPFECSSGISVFLHHITGF